MPESWWSYFYLGGLLAHQLFIICFLWRAQRQQAIRHQTISAAVLLLFIFVAELYREMLRLVGFPQPVTPIRLMWFRLVYFALGFFYCEVLYYVEKVRSLRRQS